MYDGTAVADVLDMEEVALRVLFVLRPPSRSFFVCVVNGVNGRDICIINQLWSRLNIGRLNIIINGGVSFVQWVIKNG